MKKSTSEKPTHEYVCKNLVTGTVYRNPKLPLILKMLREETGYTFKVPHGNKVRTLILEQGICRIDYMFITEHHYEITIERF
jgi:hypothetical protein